MIVAWVIAFWVMSAATGGLFGAYMRDGGHTLLGLALFVMYLALICLHGMGMARKDKS